MVKDRTDNDSSEMDEQSNNARQRVSFFGRRAEPKRLGDCGCKDKSKEDDDKGDYVESDSNKVKYDLITAMLTCVKPILGVREYAIVHKKLRKDFVQMELRKRVRLNIAEYMDDLIIKTFAFNLRWEVMNDGADDTAVVLKATVPGSAMYKMAPLTWTRISTFHDVVKDTMCAVNAYIVAREAQDIGGA